MRGQQGCSRMSPPCLKRSPYLGFTQLHAPITARCRTRAVCSMSAPSVESGAGSDQGLPCPGRRRIAQAMAVAVAANLFSPVAAVVASDENPAATIPTKLQEEPDDRIDPLFAEPKITSRVFFDISVSGAPARRFVVGCYGEIVPKTVANFEELASRPPGENGYMHTKVYRLLPGLTVQMGDVLNNFGRSGKAATEDSFPAEGYRVQHTMPGIVSMVRGPNGNVDSRFFVTTRPGDSGYLDMNGGRYVAFGRVVEGFDALLDLNAIGGRSGDSRPKAKIEIVDCGVL